MKRKILSICLAGAILLCWLPKTIAAADGEAAWVYSETGNYGLILTSPNDGQTVYIDEGIKLKYAILMPIDSNSFARADIMGMDEHGEMDTERLISSYTLSSLGSDRASTTLSLDNIQPGEYWFTLATGSRKIEDGVSISRRIKVAEALATPSPSPTPTETPTPTPTPAETPTPEPSPEQTPTPTPTPDPTPEPTPEPTPAETPTPTPEPVPTATPTATPTVAPTPSPGNDEGWKKFDKGWSYKQGGKWLNNGWHKIEEHWYLFDSKGYMLTGWQRRGSTASGQPQWYWLASDGRMRSGWQLISSGSVSRWYCFNSSGVMFADVWLKDGNFWFLMDKSGAMLTGWQKDGSTASGAPIWYYLSPNNGRMQTGWLLQGGKWFYLGNKGKMSTGVVTIDGRRHRFSSSGVWIGTV